MFVCSMTKVIPSTVLGLPSTSTWYVELVPGTGNAYNGTNIRHRQDIGYFHKINTKL